MRTNFKQFIRRSFTTVQKLDPFSGMNLKDPLPNPNRFIGKTAIITGGSNGIGLSTVELFARSGIENLVAPLYDQSYRSSAMVLVHLLSRLSVFNPELSPENVFGEKFNDFSQFVLMNPLGHGEGLRALTYPRDIFRKIEVPADWLKNSEFLQMRSHFFSRFVMDYHTRDNDSYQICTSKSCELTGKGFEKFKELFQAKDESNA
jgi:hypothetical protein